MVLHHLEARVHQCRFGLVFAHDFLVCVVVADDEDSDLLAETVAKELVPQLDGGLVELFDHIPNDLLFEQGLV